VDGDVPGGKGEGGKKVSFVCLSASLPATEREKKKGGDPFPSSLISKTEAEGREEKGNSKTLTVSTVRRGKRGGEKERGFHIVIFLRYEERYSITCRLLLSLMGR